MHVRWVKAKMWQSVEPDGSGSREGDVTALEKTQVALALSANRIVRLENGQTRVRAQAI